MNSEERNLKRAKEAGYSPDQNAAHQFLTDLRTRIATQRLPYQHGVEKAVLESLFQIFGQARETIKTNPGCEKFADLAISMLNRDIRPVTAKWHRLSERGELDSRDGADEFRSDLEALQKKIREHLKGLRIMAYGNDVIDEEIDGPFSGEELEALFADSIPYGIPKTDQIEVMKEALASEGIGATGVEEINRIEKETIEAHRKLVEELCDEKDDTTGSEPGLDAVGLACSGGGVRSATFSLGVIQVLAEKKLLRHIDILSTVSGGGFTGSFLTRRLELPDTEDSVGSPYGPDPEPIRYLRQRAKYIMSQNLWDGWEMVATTIAGMVMNWLAPIMLLVMLAGVTVLGEKLGFWKEHEARIFGVLLGVTLIGALAFFFSLKGTGKLSKWTGWFFTAATFVLVSGLAWKIICQIYYLFFGTEVFSTLDDLYLAMSDSLAVQLIGTSSFGIGGLLVLTPAVLKFLPLLKQPRFKKILNWMTLFAAAAFIPLASVALYLFLCALGKVQEFTLFDYSVPYGGLGVLVGATIGLSILTFCFLNINLTAPHRLYRNGLAGTFVRKDGEESDVVELTKINRQIVEDGAILPGFAPYHLINAAANLPTSKSPGLRERLCDFFLFSKHFCGSPVIGYRPTEEWKMNGKPADLASAMAISGAAFSSNMGMSSMPPLRALLTFLNVRLGFWIRRPQMPSFLPYGTKAKHPGFSFLLREMFGVAMSEKQRWLNLSDGGHLENLAVYELLRRRCKFIIAIDGECDPDFGFHGLVTLIRHARIDLGVRIRPDLSELRKNEECGHSRFHMHLCRISYPEISKDLPAATGLLLYVKLSTTGNESELIRRYQAKNPDFPHQTTMDQFFDEEQFEAYRQLGAHAGEGLFAQSLTSGNTDPASIHSWFKSLSKNLLLPE